MPQFMPNDVNLEESDIINATLKKMFDKQGNGTFQVMNQIINDSGSNEIELISLYLEDDKSPKIQV